MPIDIDRAFEVFSSQLTSSAKETAAAASHRDSIRVRLNTSFGVNTFFRSGSFGNGTNVRFQSDVDYFAVIPPFHIHPDSSVTLRKIAASLRERFPTTPNIRVNDPGIQLPFGLDGAEHTEVVPVSAHGTTRLGYRGFLMSDRNGGWMFTAPESHNAYVAGLNERLGKKLKPLIRMLKAWKYYRNVPVKSFYLEMVAARMCTSEVSIVYSIDLRRIFEELVRLSFLPIVDPRFNDEVIEGCSGLVARQDALSKAQNALRWAQEAKQAEWADRPQEAFRKWDMVFDYRFPAYGL